MFFLWADLNRRHSDSALCARGAERKRRRLVEQESMEGAVLAFKTYNQPLVMVYLVLYLVYNLLAVDDN